MAQHKKNFVGLDGMRGIAAIAVMIFHRSMWLGYGQLTPAAYLAVDFFFVLSGFVVAYAYYPRIQQGMSFREFFLLRVVRIYPLYTLSLLIGIIGLIIGRWVGILQFSDLKLAAASTAGFFLFPRPFYFGNIPPILPVDGPAWSLFFELAANFIFFFAAGMLTARRLLLVAFVSATLLFVVAAHFGSLHVGWSQDNFFGAIPRSLFGLAAGVLLYFVNSDGTRVRSIAVATLLFATAIVLILPYPRPSVTDPLLVILVFPTLVWLMHLFQPRGVVLSVSRELGRISFPLYVLHIPVFYLVQFTTYGLTGKQPTDFGPWLWIGTATGLLATSYLLARYFDEPLRARLNRRVRSSPKLVAA